MRDEKLKICDFTKPELDSIREQSNFTNEELALFNMRADNIPLEECAERMNLSVSAIKQKSQKINRKIERVLLMDF